MKQKLSVICNLLIFLMTAAALAMMMTGFRFSGGPTAFSAKRLAAFRYFTVDSNVLMGVTALLNTVFLLRRPGEALPRRLLLLTYVATVAVAVTLFTVVLFLGPFVLRSYATLFNDSNLFFHLIIPVFSILTLVFLERSEQFVFRHTALGLLPTAIYAVFYVTNVFLHMEQGRVSFQYDWYGFAQGGVPGAAVSLVMMLAGTYGLSVLLWLGAKKR